MYINLASKNYLSFFPPATEICNGHIQKFAPTSHVTYYAHQQNVHLRNGYHQPLQVYTDRRNMLFQPLLVVQSPYHQLWNTPTDIIPASHIQMMTIDQTANWIRTFGLFWGWLQAEAYALSFQRNEIDGVMLKHLNHEILKFDMGISNHLHRLNLLAVIKQFFPYVTPLKMTSEPKRLSDLRETDTKYDYGSKTSQMDGSHPANEENPCSLKYSVPDRDYYLRMDSNSSQNNLKSVSTKSGSDMEFSESKSPRGRMRKPFSASRKLKQEGKTAQYSFEHTVGYEGAAPGSKSFGDIHKLGVGETLNTHGGRDTSTPAKDSPAKLILTHGRLNFMVLENIRDRFLKYNFVVAIERLSRHYCVIIFQSPMNAIRALKYQRWIGYKLSPFKEVLSSARVHQIEKQVFFPAASSSDKSLNGEFLYTRDGVVTGNKYKGNNISAGKLRNDFYECETVGWVSLRSEEGIRLLQKLNGHE